MSMVAMPAESRCRSGRKTVACATLGSVLAAVLLTVLPLGAQEIVDPRSGQIFLAVTDLVVPAGPVTLEVRRTLQPRPGEPGLLGSRWRLNWEHRLVRAGSLTLVVEASGTSAFTRDAAAGAFRGLAGDRVTFDRAGRAVRLMPDGATETFDAAGRLVERHDRNGNTVMLTYDAGGRLSRVEGPRGAFLQFVTDSTGRAARVVTSGGLAVEYAYEKDLLARAVVTGAAAVRYGYDRTGALRRIEHPRYGATELDYDATRRVVRRGWADGSEERFEFDDAARLSRHVDAAGGITLRRASADELREEVVDPLGHTTVVENDRGGRPVRVTGPSGEVTRVTYDALGRTVGVENPAGLAIRTTYLDDTDLARTVTLSDGTQQTFEYDPRRNLTAIKSGDETVAEFSYTPDGLVATVRRQGEQARTLGYDAGGRLVSVADAQGGTARYEFDTRGNPVRHVNPLGGVTLRTYDPAGRLLSETDPGGATARFEYSPAGLLTRRVDPAGGVTQYAYDARGRLVAKTDPASRTTRYTYDRGSRLASVSDAAGQTTRFEYDAAGRLLREINPLGGVTVRTYDPAGRLLSETDPGGATARFEYSPAGLLMRRVDPAGGVTRYTYDARGRRVTETDPAGRVIRTTYDRAGRLVELVLPSGATRAWAHDTQANVVAESSRGAVVARYEHDALGRRVRATYPTGLEVAYRYDAIGSILAWTDNLGGSTTLAYDLQGRPTSVADASGAATRLRRDPAGRLAEVIDPLGQARRFAYTPAGELASTADASGDTARYEYDAAGSLVAVHRAGGGADRFEHDGLGNLVSTVDPLGGRVRHVYDAAGRLTRTTDARDQTTTFAYDPAGRLVEKRLPGGTVVTYRYDALSRLVEIDDGSFPIRQRHDAAGRLVAVEYPALKRALRYEYDAAGLLAKFIDGEGQVLAYEYDAARRLTAIRLPGAASVALGHDAWGRLTSIAYPNGVKGVREYDRAGRLSKVDYTDSQGKIIAAWRYAYDAAGNRIETVDAQSRPTRYRYDPAGQLVEELKPRGEAVRYAYLPGGNRGQREVGGASTTYRYDRADRLIQAGGEAFAYDADGNLAERRGSRGLTRYTWDAQNRLVAVSGPDGVEVSFGYAPTGERIWRRDAGGLTYFVHDRLNLVAELDERLRPKATYVHGPGLDRPLVMLRDSQRYFYHVDGLGSVGHLTDEQSRVAASYTYDAFGTIETKDGALVNPFGFTGREHDAAVGLYYYRARYYDPGLGRFITPDPVPGDLRKPRTFNPYQYALNHPARFVDPFGSAEMRPESPYTPVGTYVPGHLIFPIEAPRGAPGQYGSFDPYDGVVIYPDGRANPIREAATIRHEGAGHAEQHELWRAKEGLPQQIGARDVDAEVDRYIKWQESPHPRGGTWKDWQERGASWQEAHYLVRDRGLPADHPEVKRAIDYYEHHGGVRSELERALGRWEPPGFLTRNADRIFGAIAAVEGLNCLYWTGDVGQCATQAASGYVFAKVVTALTGAMATAGGVVAGFGAAISGGLAAVGVWHAAENVHDTAVEGRDWWAARQEAEAAERQKRIQRAQGISWLVGGAEQVKAAMDELRQEHGRALGAYGAAEAALARVTSGPQEARGLLGGLRQAQAKIARARALCDQAAALKAQIEAYPARAKQAEREVDRAVSGAQALAARCPAVADPGNIAQLYQAAEGLAARLGADVATLEADNKRLTKLAAESQSLAGEAVAEAQGVAADIAARVTAADAELGGLSGQVASLPPLSQAFAQRKSTLLTRINGLRFAEAAYPLGDPTVIRKIEELDQYAEAAKALALPDVAALQARLRAAEAARGQLAAVRDEARSLLGAIEGAPRCEVTGADAAVARAENAYTGALIHLGAGGDLAQKAQTCARAREDDTARTQPDGYDPRTDPGMGGSPGAGAAPPELPTGDQPPETRGKALGGGDPLPQPPGYTGQEPATTGTSPAYPPPQYPCGYPGYPPCPPIDAPPVETPWETLVPGEPPRQAGPRSPGTTAPPGPRVRSRPTPSRPPAATTPDCPLGCHPRRDGTGGCDCSSR